NHSRRQCSLHPKSLRKPLRSDQVCRFRFRGLRSDLERYMEMRAETQPARAWSAPRGVPVSILTGFLGAGKTTLLNRLIGDSWLSDAALIINEFGDVGIDHLLVESSSDGVIELSDGCLCCTVRGELVDTLADLMDRMQSGRIRPFSRVVIETTGLADPVPVMQSV